MTKEQIEEHFKNISQIEEAKKIYRKLAKKLHPDTGGSEEAFKNLNSIYNHILEHGLYFSNETSFDIDLEKIISQILHFENITIEVVGSWIWISGNTWEIKNILKDLGFKWASKKKMWHYCKEEDKVKNKGKTKDMDEIRAKYGASTVKGQSSYKLGA